MLLQGSVNRRASRVTGERLLACLPAICDFCAGNAGLIDEKNCFPEKEFALLAETGFLAAPLHTRLGGAGWGFQTSSLKDLLTVLQDLGRANLVVGRLYEGHVNGLQLVQTFGSPEQMEEVAWEVHERHKILGVWNAEAGDGVKFTPAGDKKWRLTGSKTFCSGAAQVHRPFVNGALPDGSWQMCLLRMDQVPTLPDPGWWATSGMRGTASYKIDFTGVEVDETAFIGRPNDYHRQPWLSAGAIRFAAVHLGGAESLVWATRDYLRKLNRTSDALQIDRIGKMTILLETGRLWLEKAAVLTQQYSEQFGGVASAHQHSLKQSNRLVAIANMVRTAVEQVSMEIIQHTERAIGARGLMAHLPMERVIRDLSFYLRQPGYDLAINSVGAFAFSEPGSPLANP